MLKFVGYSFGAHSLKHRATLHPDWVLVLDDAIKLVNFRIECGHRGQVDQNAAYPVHSKLRWPDSKHNTLPSLAVDLIPWPFDFAGDWRDKSRFARLWGSVEACALMRNIRLRLGIDFDGDQRTDVDNEWKDFPHGELLRVPGR